MENQTIFNILNILPLEIFYCLMDYLDFVSKMQLKQTCSMLYNELNIPELNYNKKIYEIKQKSYRRNNLKTKLLGNYKSIPNKNVNNKNIYTYTIKSPFQLGIEQYGTELNIQNNKYGFGNITCNFQKYIDEITIEIGGCTINKIYNINNKIIPKLNSILKIDKNTNIIPFLITDKIIPFSKYQEVKIYIRFSELTELNKSSFEIYYDIFEINYNIYRNNALSFIISQFVYNGKEIIPYKNKSAKFILNWTTTIRSILIYIPSNLKITYSLLKIGLDDEYFDLELPKKLCIDNFYKFDFSEGIYSTPLIQEPLNFNLSFKNFGLSFNAFKSCTLLLEFDKVAIDNETIYIFGLGTGILTIHNESLALQYGMYY